MDRLSASDTHHLRAAEGWLELGNHLEADAELDRITPAFHGDPEVLELRWVIHVQAKRWDHCHDLALALTQAVPTYPRGWIALAQTLYRRGQLKEAYDLATTKAVEFPKSAHLLYDAACYACVLGKRTEAESYLQKAMAAGDPKAIKLRALDDPDLDGLWRQEL